MPMSRVKVLHRRPALPVGPVLNAPAGPFNALKGLFSNVIDTIGEKAASALATRKSADGGPLSIAERVREFIARNAPDAADIAPDFVLAALTKLKTPILVALGIAAIAGLIYLAYKLYKHWTARKAEDTIATIMEDLKATAPDVLAVPGWLEQVAARVAAAVESGPEAMVEQVAQIKAELLDKQHKTNPAGAGAGIDLFVGPGRARRPAGKHYGTGLVAA